MVLFFTPFLTVFYIRNRRVIREKKPHFNQFMEKFFASGESNWLVFAWAAAEAVLWFIIPEFLLVLIVFMKVRHKVHLLVYDIIGTVVGAIVGLWWHASDRTLLHIPYIFEGMITQVRTWYETYGIWGLFFQPFSGVPFKVFTNVALDYHFFIPLFIIIAVIARVIRYVIAYELTKALFPVVHPFVRKHYGWLFILAIAVFTGLLLRVSYIYSL